MKKVKIITGLLTGALLFGPQAEAKQYLNEDFNYTPGALYNQGGWLQYNANSSGPIQVVTTPLSYAGYQTTAKGNAAYLKGANDGTDQKLWIDGMGENFIGNKVVYASALINVSKVNDGTFFFTFAQAGSSGFADKKGANNYGKIFALPGSTEGKFKLGVTKSKSSADATYADELDLNTTYLVVMKWEMVDGVSNDKFSVWVNPATGLSTEPAADLSVTAGSDFYTGETSRGVRGVTLFQNGASTLTRTAPEVTVDAVRMADTWSDLFTEGAGGEEPAGDATISINPTTMDEIYSLVGYKYTFPVTVTGKNLTEDITIELPADFSANVTTIPAAAAMSATGFTVNITNQPSAAHTGKTSTITFRSTGAPDMTLNVTTSADATTEIARCNQIANMTADGETIYRYTGKATVTWVDTKGKKIYAQDVFGGMAIDCQYLDEIKVNVGDKLTNIFATLTKSLNVPYLLPIGFEVGEVIETGATKEPSELTYKELLDDPGYYVNRLVKVNGLNLETVDGNWEFKVYNATDGEANGTVRPFGNSDLIGTALPSGKFSLTGIVTNAAGMISPRTSADVVATATFDVTAETTFTGDAVAMGEEVEVGKITVKREGLGKAAAVYLTGAGRAHYSIDVDEIPAGTGETVVTLKFKPTAIGRHTASIYFDVTPTELSTSKSFTFAAYDPNNMPTISCDASSLTAFAANAGSTQEQTLVVKTANLIDYGSAKLTMASGAFRINSTSLLKNGDTQIKVTFAPQKEGTFSDRIELSAMKAETVYVDVTGSTTGGVAPEDKQGDELVLDTTNPLKLMIQGFDGQTNNKPLKLQGWVNNAAEGTRAWWGYTFNDGEDAGNTAAKVTGYDMKIASGEGTKAEMLLITPALDYKNAAEQLLTFRLMGDNLGSSPTDELEVLYIEKDGDGMYSEALQGMNIPVTSDYNKEWVDYVVDLSNQNLADVFFIGFRYSTTRGKDTSTIYYIDDVTWGREDVPMIKPGTSVVEIIAEQGVEHSETLEIGAKNLTEPIALSLGGDNPSNFTLSHESLPAEGGTLGLKFKSDNAGVHQAYIQMESKGAPTSYVVLAANVKETSGITVITPDANGKFTVYTLSGVKVLETEHPDGLKALQPGIYVVNGAKYYVK